MKRERFMIRDDRGASLIAVLVTLAVVSMLGVIISQLTVTNIQMKEAERQSKAIFYSAEKVMDALTAGLNNYASEAMQEAYNDMLANYRDLTSGGEILKDIFGKIYIDKLVEKFQTPDSASGTEVETHIEKVDVDGKAIKQYVVGYYSLDEMRGALSSYVDGSLIDEDDPEKKPISPYKGKESTYMTDEYYLYSTTYSHTAKYLFHADYVNKVFTLEKVAITCRDEAGNSTTIQTDIVFHVPEVNFNGSNVVKDFMRYSLIADEGIKVDNTGIDVDGNVYAGSNGIYAEQGKDATFHGNKIVTRGDITVTSSGKLILGDVSKLNTQIWCENLITKKELKGSTGKENSATLTAAGNIFVSDDLELNGAYDTVTLKGNYFGYNFQENYGTASDSYKGLNVKTNDNYSSAININGLHSELQIAGLSRLMIAGRTFIDRETGKEEITDEDGNKIYKSYNDFDIPLAEALSVRPNQMAYYVSPSYVDDTTKKIDDSYRDNFIELYQKRCNFPSGKNIFSFLNPSQEVLAFTYIKSNSGKRKTDTVYYLNFANENAANEFYGYYFKNNRDAIDLTAKNYLEIGAFLSEGIVLDLRGNLLYRDKTGKLNEIATKYNDNDWKVGSGYYTFASSHAVQYHSLQMYLEDHHEGIDPANVRVKKGKNRMVGAENDKEDPLTTVFHNLLDYTIDVEEEDKQGELNKFFTRVKTKEYIRTFKAKKEGVSEESQETKVLIIVDNRGKEPYPVSTATYSGGLIIATGDVQVTCSSTSPFSGTIISGGTIDFGDSAYIRPDEVLVSQLISQDLALRSPIFATIFNAYKNMNGSAAKTDRVADYLTFENWTKTVE